MTDIGELERPRSLRPHRGADVPQRGDDGVDDEAVLVGVLGRPHERRGVDTGPRQRARDDRCTGLAHEQLGAGADEPAVGIYDATGLRPTQVREQRGHVEGMVGDDVDGAGEHDLL
jgi:hypothetical protein